MIDFITFNAWIRNHPVLYWFILVMVYEYMYLLFRLVGNKLIDKYGSKPPPFLEEMFIGLFFIYFILVIVLMLTNGVLNWSVWVLSLFMLYFIGAHLLLVLIKYGGKSHEKNP